MTSLTLRRFLIRHAAAALREIGVLLLAFTPLDVALSGGGHRLDLLVFIAAAMFALAVGVALDWRSRNVD